MFKLNISLVVLFVHGVVINAAVIKQSNEKKNVFETTTVSNEDVAKTMKTEITTFKSDSSEHINIETTEKLGAFSRDKEATILIVDQSLLDSAPAELIKSKKKMVQVEKSGKLLLLSTPKIAEKSKQPEENFDESEETDETVESITENATETTTIVIQNEETTKALLENAAKYNYKQITNNVTGFDDITTGTENPTTESPLMDMTTSISKITKLYPINDTLYETNNNERSVFIVDDQLKETSSSNVESIILEEAEADYVLADSDFLEGSYTDVDSEVHLQPIVQSVEIVPSSLDETLLINYVQSW